MNDMHVTEPTVTRAPEPDWSDWDNWLRSHLEIQREVLTEGFGEALGLVSHELRDRISALELKLAELSGAVDILRGAQPPPPAQFPSVKAFSADTIYHEGDIVAFAGGTYQATKDTARAPGAKDWICLARSADSLSPRGAYDDHADYRCLDVIMVDGSSFVALKDAPGPCPGDDWQLLASRGSRGDRGLKGERGLPGPKGDAGASGATIRDWKIQRERYVATPVMSDGSDGPPLELRGLFEQFLSEVQG
jgi:hypothetical protein